MPPTGMSMIRAFLLALGDLRDPRVLRVLAVSLAVTLLLMAVVAAGLGWGATWLVGDRLAWGTGAGRMAGLAAAVGAVLLGWLLFRTIAIAVLGLLADGVVEAVERRRYPAAHLRARPVSTGRAARMALGSVARAVAINLLLAPAYLALLASGIGTPLLFLAVNGWLLGRDLFDMVAARHLPPAAMRQLRAATRGQRMLLGLAGTGLLVVPLLGLLGPVLGAAAATHWYHGRER